MSEDSRVSAVRRPTPRELVAMVTVAVLLVFASLSGFLAVNRTLNSPAGFVSQYLDALARRDINSILAMPGALPEDLSREHFLNSTEAALINPSALSELQTYRIIDEEDLGDVHRVVVETMFGSGKFTDSPSAKKIRSVFTIRHSTILGLIDQSSFEDSPLASLMVNTQHSTFFDVNDFGPVDIAAVDNDTKPGDFAAAYRFAVFAPGLYSVRVASASLTSPVVGVSVADPGESVSATVIAEPTSGFISRVQREVDDYFDACTKQQVLLPSGCPFGIQIANRLVGKPTWVVEQYPTVNLVAGANGWEILPAPMRLTFIADIQSLFDGSITPVAEAVPLTIAGTVGLTASGDVSVMIRNQE